MISLAGCASSSKSTTAKTTPGAGQPDNTDLPVAANNAANKADTVAADTVSTASTEATAATTTTTKTVTSVTKETVVVDYTVASGDSLWKIAHQFGTSVVKLKKLNGLTTDNLSVGQKLKVPQKQ